MKSLIIPCFAIILLSCNISNNSIPGRELTKTNIVQVKLCIEDHAITHEWRKALTSRQSSHYLDSLSDVKRIMTEEELEWYQLIKSRADHWSSLTDSLKVPFGDLMINDSIFVWLGYQGNDDGFTYEYQTVCFDLTALQNAYGDAEDYVNTNRIDRLFAHEYTHLLSKEWARQTNMTLQNFEDSILWECIYEGLGMYRSMSSKWFPRNDSLSTTSAETFETLYPIFTERLITIHRSPFLTTVEKSALQKNLSRGSMQQKWGALPVGVWLAMEANGDDKNLTKWVSQGHHAVIPLALKYLPQEYKTELEKSFVE